MGSAFVEDEAGTKHRVSFSSHEQDDQVIILVDPVRISLQLPSSTFVVDRGGSIEIPVKVVRGTGLAGDVRVHITAPPHIKGWSAKPFVVAAKDDAGILTLQVDENANRVFNAPLIVNATIKDGSGKPIRTESRVHIRFRDNQSVSQLSTDKIK